MQCTAALLGQNLGEEKVEQVCSRSHTAQEVYSFGALVITTPPACHGQYTGNY